MSPLRKKILLTACLFWLLVLVGGCTPYPTNIAIYGLLDRVPLEIYIDRAILNDEPCALPCWKNIIPGKTRSEDAVQSVKTDIYGDKYAMIKGDLQNGWLEFNTRFPGRQFGNKITWEDGTVTEIRLDLNFPFTVEQMLAKFGEPEGLEGDHDNLQHRINLDFYYPSKGFVFWAPTEEGSFDLQPTTSVDIMYAFPPMSIEERLRTIFNDEVLPALIIEKIRQWEGYGNVVDTYYGGDINSMLLGE